MMATASQSSCLACGALAEPADQFCEACGCSLADGSGTSPSTRNHIQVDLGAVAGVTDRGHKHARNEDAMALVLAETPGGLVSLAVVCDGVSTSTRPDEASQIAAETALSVLAGALEAGMAIEDALLTAALSADAAVRDLDEASVNAPATTFMAGVAAAAAVSVCWVGDSRAYWLPADDAIAAQLLTCDDSFAEELAAAGALTEAEALTSPHAHVLTRWLGADAEPIDPHVAVIQPPSPGILLLCSDGLWNYEPAAEGLRRLAGAAPFPDLAGAADALVAFALEAGGQDNVTVVLSAVPPLHSVTNDHEGTA
jgi:serine/threonine protein phosphatase PrpC